MSHPAENRFPWRTVLLFSVIAILMAGAGAWVYREYIPTTLTRLNAGSGELKMREGERLESAGAQAAAIAAYQEALPLAFSGSFNRVHVLKRLGTLLVQQGAYEESLPYLREYVENPESTVQGYETLCTALLRLANRGEDLDATAQRWLERAHTTGNLEQEGLALYYLGLSAKALGALGAAEEHLRLSAERIPGGRPDAELGQLLYEKKEFAEAKVFLKRYLESGGSGKRAVEVRRLLDTIASPSSPAL